LEDVKQSDIEENRGSGREKTVGGRQTGEWSVVGQVGVCVSSSFKLSWYSVVKICVCNHFGLPGSTVPSRPH
jgi:hypothetical protein